MDHITASLCYLASAAQLYKVDISRAFCQIRMEPGDIYWAYGFHSDFMLDHYFSKDTVMPSGLLWPGLFN